MKGFIGVILAKAPQFVRALNDNRSTPAALRAEL